MKFLKHVFSLAARQSKPQVTSSTTVITTRRPAAEEINQETGVKSLAQIRQERMKRLGVSLSQEEGEQGNIKKRIKVSEVKVDWETSLIVQDSLEHYFQES